MVEAPFDGALLERPGFPGGFDAVVFMESIYHFFDLREALETALALLCGRGGKLILKAFDVDSFPIRCLRNASLGINGLSIPVNGSPRLYGRMLGENGFHVLRVYRCPSDVLACIGLRREAVGSRLALAVLRGLAKASDVALRAAGESRNFVLVAEKR